jgi:hypothetical protein
MQDNVKEALSRGQMACQGLLAVPNWFSRSGFSSGFRRHQVESALRSLRTVPSHPYEAPFSSAVV